MDRKSIFILIACFGLLLLWGPLVNKVFPPTKIPTRTDTSSSVTNGGTNAAASAGGAASVNQSVPTPLTAPVPVTPSAPEELLDAVRAVHAGKRHLGTGLADPASQGATPTSPLDVLTAREFEVFRLLVAGRGPTEIADQLHLSVKTVSTHKTRILEKMGVGSTADLVRYAVENGLS